MLKERPNLLLVFENLGMGRNPFFMRVSDLAAYHGLSRKWILELDRRFFESEQDPKSLLPIKIGPQGSRNRPDKILERLVLKNGVDLMRPLGFEKPGPPIAISPLTGSIVRINFCSDELEKHPEFMHTLQQISFREKGIKNEDRVHK